MLVWIMSGAFDRFLDLDGKGRPGDSVYRFSRDGKLTPVLDNEPPWMESHDAFTQTGGLRYGYEKRRAKNYVKCK